MIDFINDGVRRHILGPLWNILLALVL
jgi:hypothetical protein